MSLESQGTPQPSTRGELDAHLGRHLINQYSQVPFGRTSKADVDVAIFSTIAQLHLHADDALWRNGQFLRLRLDGHHRSGLSLKLLISETKVASIVEQAAFAQGMTDLDANADILEFDRLEQRCRQDVADLKQGKNRLYIPNRVIRREIEAVLAQAGGIPETSFHRDQLVVRLEDVISAYCVVTGQNQDRYLQHFVARLKRHLTEQEHSELRKAQNLSTSAERFSEFLNRVLKTVSAPAVSVSVNAVLTSMPGGS